MIVYHFFFFDKRLTSVNEYICSAFSVIGGQGRIRFEKGAENDVYKYEIDKVWIHFHGLARSFGNSLLFGQLDLF